ncbi:unnamed protein product [Diplocarpon coronariae]
MPSWQTPATAVERQRSEFLRVAVPGVCERYVNQTRPRVPPSASGTEINPPLPERPGRDLSRARPSRGPEPCRGP